MGSHRAQGRATSRPRDDSPARFGELTGAGRHRASGRRANGLRANGLHAKPAAGVWTSKLPRAGVAGALGVVAVLAPIVGPDLAGGGATTEAVVAPSSAAAGAEATDAAATGTATQDSTPDGTAAASPPIAAEFRILPPAVAAIEVPPPAVSISQARALPVEELMALRVDAEQASRAQERALLPGCSGVAPATQPANGLIDTGELCVLWDGGQMLRADAAVALARLNADYFAEFDTDMCITDSYRSYAEQVAVRRQKPGLAARPGTSQHGWGLAVDVCSMQNDSGGPYTWLRQHAPAHGWDNPEWARSGGSGPHEPWHWEYVAGQPSSG